MTAPTKIHKINVDELEIRPAPAKDKKTTAGGMFHVYHGKYKLRVMLPVLKAIFGASENPQFPGKVKMPLSFEKFSEEGLDGEKLKEVKKHNREIEKAHQKMLEIDNKISELIFEQKEVFFKDCKKKGMTDDVIRARYQTFIKSDDEGNRADQIAVQLQRKSENDSDYKKLEEDRKSDYLNQFRSMKDFDLFITPDGERVDINYENVSEKIPWGSEVKCVLDLSYIWNTGDKCTVTWAHVHGILVATSPRKSFNILDEDDEEEDEDMENDDEDANEGSEEMEEDEEENAAST